MSVEHISVTKIGGARDIWNREKLRRSLFATGAPNDVVETITSHIEKDLYDGMHTTEIYKHAFSLLKKYHRPLAAQYSLKKAIMQLGPTGFPFEKFVSHILEKSGYKTTVGVMAKGLCVTHEVDVIAEKEDERIIVEAKYHNSPEIKSDVKVALYVRARFQDIAEKMKLDDSSENQHFHSAWLITNTSFTSQAIQYGQCVGLAMTGWNYPKGKTLQDIVQATQTHPITSLTTLSSPQKQHLISNGIILCQDILKNPDQLGKIGITHDKLKQVIEEGQALCPLM
jgi:hypothetical protein